MIKHVVVLATAVAAHMMGKHLPHRHRVAANFRETSRLLRLGASLSTACFAHLGTH